MRKLQELVIDGFLGKNINADPSDIEHHQCQTIEGFEISRKIGSLVKSNGYELATDVLGLSYTATYKLVDYDGSVGTISSIKGVYQWHSDNGEKIVIFANDGTEDRLYYWDNLNKRWQQLDSHSSIGTYDQARFNTRSNSLIVGSGVGATNYPVFAKYYAARTILGAATANQAAGYYSYKNTLPYNNNLTMEITDFDGGGFLEDGKYNYYACLVYDNGQYGEVSSRLAADGLSCNDDGAYLIKLSISNTNGDALSRRVTHLAIFRDFFTYAEAAYTYSDWVRSKLLCVIPVDNNPDSLFVVLTGDGSFSSATNKIGGFGSTENIVNDQFIGMYLVLWTQGGTKIYKRITDNDTSFFTLENGTGLVDGTLYMWNVVSYWWDNGSNYECYILDRPTALITSVQDAIGRTTRKATEANWKYSVFHHNWGFYAPIYLVDDAELHENWLGVSSISGEGNYQYDMISNYINLQDYGVNVITGLGRLIDSLIVFSETDIHKLNIASGTQFSWSLEETLQDVGCVAPDSLAYCIADDFKYSGYYYVSRDGIRVYDGYKSYLISYPIQDNDNYPIGVSDLTEAVGVYDDYNKQYIISFPTDGIVLKYDLRTGEWLGDMDYPHAISWWTITEDGELLGTDGASILLFNDDGSPLTNYAGEYINPVWKSKLYDFGHPGVEKILHEISITYKSNTEIKLKWYIDRSSTANEYGTSPFKASSTAKTIHVGFPIGTRGYEFEFEIGLAASYIDDNTVLEIDEIRLYYTVGRSGGFQNA